MAGQRTDRNRTGPPVRGSAARPVDILESMASFRYDGQRLAYTTYGEGLHTTVLMPGLLLSQKLQRGLARDPRARRSPRPRS
jgi:hypothetical protein